MGRLSSVFENVDGGAAILTQTTQGKQILIDGADHFSLTMNPEHAQIVAKAIVEMIQT